MCVLGGAVTCVHTRGVQVSGPPRKTPGWAFAAQWVGCSSGAGWTGPRCRALASEGRPVAALWARVRHPQSPRSRRPFRTPAIRRPGGLALGLQPRRGNGGGAGPGRGPGRHARARAAGWPGGRASCSQPPPPGSGWQGRPSVQVCMCVRVFLCVHTPVCQALGPERTPGSPGELFPHQEHSGDWGQDLMRCCEPPACLQVEKASIRTVLAARPPFSYL